MTVDPQTSATFILSCLATGLTFACVYYHINVFSYWSSKGIKGPRPWPLLGTTIYYILRPRIEVDNEWTRKYGKVYGVYEGYSPVLRITDNELIKHIWIKNFQKFTDRNNNLVKSDHMSRWLFFSKGEHWNNQRILITPMFTSSKMKNMFGVINNCVDRFLREINSRLGLTANGSGGRKTGVVEKDAVFSKNELMSLNLDVIGKTFFDLDLNTYRDKASEFYKRAFAFAEFDVAWAMIYFLIPKIVREWFKIDLTREYKYEFFSKLSRKRIHELRALKRSDGAPSVPTAKQNNFVQHLIDARLQDTGDQSIYTAEDDNEAHFNDQMNHNQLEKVHEKQQTSKGIKFRQFEDLEIEAQMVFFFLAGFETTSSSSTMVIYELSHNLNLQERVYQEIRDALNPGEAAANDFANQYTKLMELQLLDAFISETMRLYSPVTEHSRVVTDKNGVLIPTSPPIFLPYRANVSAQAFTVHRDPDYWLEPEKFDITRFYRENKDKIKSCAYMPFGLGPRNCVGMRFALLNMKITIAKLLLNYTILPGPKTKEYPPKFKKHGFFTQFLHTDFTLEPRNN